MTADPIKKKGNARATKRSRRPKRSAYQILLAVLHREIEFEEDGLQRRGEIIELILTMLLHKAMDDSDPKAASQATNILFKYNGQDKPKTKPKIIVQAASFQ